MMFALGPAEMSALVLHGLGLVAAVMFSIAGRGPRWQKVGALALAILIPVVGRLIAIVLALRMFVRPQAVGPDAVPPVRP